MRDQPRKTIRRRRNAEPLLLGALLLLAIAAGLALVPNGQVALADLLFQSPPTNTPDPNSPLPTPTFTWTPFSADTPTPFLPLTSTPTPALLFATGTPTATPTNAPPIIAPLAPPVPPATPTPETIIPSATLPATAEPITPSQEIIVIIPPPEEAAAPGTDQAVRSGLDAALFIDNLVIAFGYVWLCFGALALVGAALGAIYLWRRRSQPPDLPMPPVEPPQPAAAPRATGQPSPPKELE